MASASEKMFLSNISEISDLIDKLKDYVVVKQLIKNEVKLTQERNPAQKDILELANKKIIPDAEKQNLSISFLQNNAICAMIEISKKDPFEKMLRAIISIRLLEIENFLQTEGDLAQNQQEFRMMLQKLMTRIPN